MELAPELPYYYYGRSCVVRGQIGRSAELFRKVSDVRLDDFQSICLARQSRRIVGRTDEAREVNRESLVRAERILGRGWGHRDWIEHDLDYDVLRDHPRFKALLAKLK